MIEMVILKRFDYEMVHVIAIVKNEIDCVECGLVIEIFSQVEAQDLVSSFCEPCSTQNWLSRNSER